MMDEIKFWEKLQDKRVKEYDQGFEGFFTGEKSKGARKLKKVIGRLLKYKNCLDIGCGILKWPPYMSENVYWHGIDPVFKDSERGFVFTHAIAEDLPYTDNTFSGVLFSTSLDHVIDPVKAIKEAYRVLEPGGYMFIWGGIVDEDKKYKQWKAKKQPAMYDKHHCHAFIMNDIISLAYRFKLKRRIQIRKNIIIQTINRLKGYSREFIFIFQKMP